VRVAPTCVNCGCLVGNEAIHGATKCRKKKQILLPGQCPETQLAKDARGRIRNLPCALEDKHEWHEIDFEGYRHRWMTRELIA
jgi:hypothetical protein